MKRKPVDTDNHEALLTAPINRKRFLKLSGYGSAAIAAAPFAYVLAGQHTQYTGVYKNPDSPALPQLAPSMPTIGHMLREAGCYKGKWHLGNIDDNGVECPGDTDI